MKKVLSIILILAMLLSTLVLTVNAAETNTQTPVAGYSDSLIEKLTDEQISSMTAITSSTPKPAANSVWKSVDEAGFKRFIDWQGSGWCVIANNITVYLVADLDLAAYPNLQVSGGNFWGGTFDGQGHTIKNWNLTVDGTASNPNGSLFSLVNGTIKNLVLDSSCSVKYTTAQFTRGTSSLVACLCTDGVVYNCKSSATVDSDFSNVSNDSYARSSAKVGGIIGRLESATDVTIQNLTYAGTLTSAVAGGGIVGYVQGGTVAIRDCVNEGNITAEYEGTSGSGYYRAASGGIVGLQDYNGTLTINNCHNYGIIKNGRNITSANAGSIIGIVCQDGTININDCNNYGSLVSVGHNSGVYGNKFNACVINVNNYNDYRTLPQIEGYQTEFVDDSATAQGLRIIGSIDSLDYQDVGFNITIKDANGNIVKDNNGNDVVIENYKCKYVYTSLVGMDGDTQVTYSRDTLRPNGYLFAVVIPNIPEALGKITVEVSTFCVTTEGNTVAGESYTFTHTVGTN